MENVNSSSNFSNLDFNKEEKEEGKKKDLKNHQKIIIL